MDKMKTVYAKNSLTGLTEQVPEDHLNHPVLGAHLTQVRNAKRRERISDIAQDDNQSSATRVTNVATPDKDKED